MITKIINNIDKFLNNTPMYKLVLYILNTFILAAFLLSILGVLDYSPLSLFYSLVSIVSATLFTNFLAAKIFKLDFQTESTLITAFILFLILQPIDSLNIFAATLIASVSAILSKYLITYKNTHVFNPAAFGLFFAGILGYGISFWWVGNIYLFPLVTVGALLLIRKVKKFDLVIYAIAANIFGLFIASYFYQIDIVTLVRSTFISGPLIFFLGFMATEPHTLPGRKIHQIIYIVFIILFPILFNLLEVYSVTPETSLLLANAIFMFVGNRMRLILKLKEKKEIGTDIFEYSFTTSDKVEFIPGQYTEILLPHTNVDIRGTRRYFTISSTPNPDNSLSFTTKFPIDKMSSWKNALKNIDENTRISATQIGGDFLLPKDINQKLVFIAGGIGVTPFISFIRYMLQNNESRNIVLIYCVKNESEVAFKDLLKEAENKLNLKLVVVTEILSKEILMQNIKNPEEYEYYISGPNGLVTMMYKTLKSFNMKKNKIHTDYFPGF